MRCASRFSCRGKGLYKATCGSSRVGGTANCRADGNTVNSGGQYRRDVLAGDTSYGKYRYAYTQVSYVPYEVTRTLSAKRVGQTALGGSKTPWA